MLPIITFTGFSESGKTTVTSAIISELSARGYKVTSIKHDGHGHKLEGKSGSDSERHKDAGAICSIISNKNGYMLVADSSRDASPQELAALAPAGTDIVICEGFKSAIDIAKIEVYRTGERSNKGDRDLVAIVTDADVDDNVTKLGLNDHKAIADFIENNYIKIRPDIALHLIVDGKHVPTKDFILQMLTYSIHGLIKPLKGCDNPKEIIIKATYN